MAATTPLDTTIDVVTPENIAFEYQLAGPFRRFPAFLIDLAVRWGIILGLFFSVMIMGGLLTIVNDILGAFTAALGVIAAFLISWFYGTVMEAYYNGRTIGKWACGIRVIDIEGRPVSGRSALLRNLLRIADMFPAASLATFDEEFPDVMVLSTAMLGLITMLCTRRLQRLGDLAAGTMVIVDERTWRLPVGKVDDARVPALAAYIPGDYRVSRTMARTLAIYAERRHYLTQARRREIARHLTDRLIDRFEFRKDIDPDLLLYALYYKTFLAESGIEEPDLGPLRGYSPLARDENKVKSDSTASPLSAGIGELRDLRGNSQPQTQQRPQLPNQSPSTSPQTAATSSSSTQATMEPPRQQITKDASTEELGEIAIEPEVDSEPGSNGGTF